VAKPRVAWFLGQRGALVKQRGSRMLASPNLIAVGEDEKRPGSPLDIALRATARDPYSSEATAPCARRHEGLEPGPHRGFSSAPERTRTSTGQSAHKALNQNHGA